jgi:isoquinoline 1-oxidoreductase alpha subunit
MNLTINGKAVQADAEPDMPLLWVLRDQLNLTGTKFGCGVAACGACTVHVDGVAVRSCVTPASSLEGKQIRTIESLGSAEKPHALQLAWVAEQVPQCGYCQSGMLMAAAALIDDRDLHIAASIRADRSRICGAEDFRAVFADQIGFAGGDRAARRARAAMKRLVALGLAGLAFSSIAPGARALSASPSPSRAPPLPAACDELLQPYEIHASSGVIGAGETSGARRLALAEGLLKLSVGLAAGYLAVDALAPRGEAA